MLTKKQIDVIIRNTPKALKGSQKYFFTETIGYHMPNGANWSYQAGYIEYKKRLVLVVKQFGTIQ